MHTHVRMYVDPLYNLPLVLQRLTALTSGHKKTTSLLFRWATGRLVQVALQLQIWIGCGYESSFPPCETITQEATMYTRDPRHLLQ